VIPPPSPVSVGFEAVKKFFGNKNNQSIHRAQYSILVHEFADNWLDEFVDSQTL